jgi:Reverse transcriptase (RNA-dependent DNA polymerase)
VLLDARRVNKVVKTISNRMENLKEVLNSLTQAKPVWFCMIDLFYGYFNCKITPDSKYLFAFQTANGGVYTLTRLVQGYVDSAATFQYLIDLTLNDLRHKQCLICFDDIAIYASTLDELFQNMQSVFDRLRGAKLRIHPAKCQFATDTAKFLGFVFHKGTVMPYEAKIKIVQNYPRPTTARKVRSFLGLTVWFRSYIRNFSKISEPLRELIKKQNLYGQSNL